MLVDQKGPPIWRQGNQRKLEFILRSKRLLLAHKINYVCMHTSLNVNEDRHFFSKRPRLKRGLDSGLYSGICVKKTQI